MDSGREILEDIFSNLTGDSNIDIPYLNSKSLMYQNHPESAFIAYEINRRINLIIFNAKKREYTDIIFDKYINKKMSREEMDALINQDKIDLPYYISKVDGKVKELEEKRRIKTLQKEMEEKIAEIELKAKLSTVVNYMDSNSGVATEYGQITQDEMSKLLRIIDGKLSEVGEIGNLVNRINHMISDLETGIEISNKSEELKRLHQDVETKLQYLKNTQN